MINIEEAGWQVRDTLSWIHGEGMPKGLNLGEPVRRLDSNLDWDGYGTTLKPAWEPVVLAQKSCRDGFAKNAVRFGCGGLNIDDCRISTNGSDEGRWPANLLVDEEAAKRIIGREKSRIGERLKGHFANNVWERRKTPPDDWNKPLPEHLLEASEESYLRIHQEELDSGEPEDYNSTNRMLRNTTDKIATWMPQCSIM